jgi:hypothetical protein
MPPARKPEDDILDIPDPLDMKTATARNVILTVSPEEKARREAVKKKEREAAEQLLATYDSTAIAATRHGWLMFTVPEKPVGGGC